MNYCLEGMWPSTDHSAHALLLLIRGRLLLLYHSLSFLCPGLGFFYGILQFLRSVLPFLSPILLFLRSILSGISGSFTDSYGKGRDFWLFLWKCAINPLWWGSSEQKISGWNWTSPDSLKNYWSLILLFCSCFPLPSSCFLSRYCIPIYVPTPGWSLR